MGRYSLGELPPSPPEIKAKPRLSLMNATMLMDACSCPSRLTEWFKIFCEHPHTWLMIRILAIIKLVFYFDVVAVFLLMDVVRTVLFANERRVDVKDNPKDVTVGDLSTVMDGFIQTAEGDSQTDNVEISVEKHDPEECSEVILPEKEVAETEMQTEEVTKVFPSLEDVSVQTIDEDKPPSPEVTDCGVQTDTERISAKETADVESETVVVETMTIETQTDEQEMAPESPQRETKDSDFQTEMEIVPTKEGVDCRTQKKMVEGSIPTADADNQTDDVVFSVEKRLADVDTQTEEEQKPPEGSEAKPEKTQVERPEQASVSVQTDSEFQPIPAFIDRLYSIYTEKNKGDSRRVDFDVNEALNEELKDKQADLERKIVEIEDLKSKLTELDNLENELTNTKERVVALEQEKDELKDKLVETQAELTKMETVVDSSLNEYGLMEERLAAIEREAEVKENRIEDLCEEIAEWKERCAKMTMSVQSSNASFHSSFYPDASSKTDVNLIEI
ncbi:hypothetical protein RvY_14393 [Ramazzottius varieornatus]|uniref:Uncharacterized protein n=1 Tax=Ramazzottius varieornatus TaxID=947166 RepID=A0A1D1VYG7_RAMVA|nr:hypothetical protein RvY_14393 [Ramazzottius varieornatus]